MIIPSLEGCEEQAAADLTTTNVAAEPTLAAADDELWPEATADEDVARACACMLDHPEDNKMLHILNACEEVDPAAGGAVPT